MRAIPTPPFARQLTLEALQQAVRWPHPNRQTVLALVGQFLATRRDRDGFAYFTERALAAPDEPLFQALEGLFQARLTNSQSLIKRLPWLNDAIAKLDRAVTQAPGLTTYFRGLVLADAPGVLRRADAAVADLEWMLANRAQFPTGLMRSVYRALARAYTTLERTAEAHTALERSGYPSLSAEEPQFVTDGWMTAQDGYRFVLPRLVEMAPRIYVAQGYDFADLAFVLTDAGIVAIDAGSTVAHVEAALIALRKISPLPITHVILTHAHWDHIGGLKRYSNRASRSSPAPGTPTNCRSSTRPGFSSRLSVPRPVRNRSPSTRTVWSARRNP